MIDINDVSYASFDRGAVSAAAARRPRQRGIARAPNSDCEPGSQVGSTRLSFHTLDVFTDRLFGGNQLAVVLDGEDLATAEMQAVAAEFNLSETVFVLKAKARDHAFRLRIFTPAVELPLAGHPTIGAAHLLVHLGMLPTEPELHLFEENIGSVPVRVRDTATGLYVEMEGSVPPRKVPIEIAESLVAEVLGLAPADFHSGLPIAAYSSGVPFLFVPLGTTDALSRVRVSTMAWERHLMGGPAPQLYVFAETAQGPDFQARMFAPAFGIAEDPATGGAALAFAGYLFDVENEGPLAPKRLSWQVAQGVEMGRPSMLSVAVEHLNGRVTASYVGGPAVHVSAGTIAVRA